MIRTILALSLVSLTVACGPADSSSSETMSKSKHKTTSYPSSSSSSLSDDFSDSDSSSIDTTSASSTASSPSPSTHQAQYPIDADPSLTPGVKCQHPSEYRYPSQIAYCDRSVSTGTKNSVIRDYDHQLGYQIEEMSRSDFKIDHYIPLCMGGDNAKTNLWPQHKSVYTKTDPIEMYLCQRLEKDQITQDEAIDQMMYAKAHLDEASSILAKIKAAL